MNSTSKAPAVSRGRALAVLGAAAAAASAAPARAQSTPKTYTFGGMFPMTGGAAEIGQDFVRGMNLAVDEINARGGVDGWQLKAIVVDHKGNAAGGVQAMNQLVNLEKVPYVLSSFAGVTLAAQPIAAQN